MGPKLLELDRDASAPEIARRFAKVMAEYREQQVAPLRASRRRYRWMLAVTWLLLLAVLVAVGISRHAQVDDMPRAPLEVSMAAASGPTL